MISKREYQSALNGGRTIVLYQLNAIEGAFGRYHFGCLVFFYAVHEVANLGGVSIGVSDVDSKILVGGTALAKRYLLSVAVEKQAVKRRIPRSRATIPCLL